MKNLLKTIIVLMLLTIISCESDETEININPKSVTDCGLPTDPQFEGLCLDGATSVLPNEVITYASKYTTNYSEILWTIESGSIEILNIENSIVDGVNKSIVTIKFNFDFSGGSLKVKAFDIRGSSAEISDYQIELGNE
jgi:hypothetical protein